MRWVPLESGTSWWLENAEGISQAYVVKVEDKYRPCIMLDSKYAYFVADTLEAAKEHVLVMLAANKLEGA
jgi:hypothetical protein